MTISRAIRQRIRQRANFLCEYCHSSEEASTALFTLDHLLPKSLGGNDDEENRYWTCDSSTLRHE
jgi:5-methylcytosine-specific restriction endonuclease McrA